MQANRELARRWREARAKKLEEQRVKKKEILSNKRRNDSSPKEEHARQGNKRKTLTILVRN